MSAKVFYHMKLTPTEGGLSIWTDKYHSVHETECFHFCIAEWQCGYANVSIQDGETMYQSLKRRGVKLKRIAKINSRFAFDTEQKAYDQLVFLKRKQLGHLQRDIEFLKAFMEFNKENGFDNLKKVHSQVYVPDTKDLVNEHYLFD